MHVLRDAVKILLGGKLGGRAANDECVWIWRLQGDGNFGDARVYELSICSGRMWNVLPLVVR